MTKQLKELFDNINKKKKEVRDLIAENKLEEARKAKDKLVEMQEQFDILFDLEEEEKEEKANQAKATATSQKSNEKKDKKKNIVTACVNMVKARLKNEPISENDVEAYNAMNEETTSEGGILVPQDIRTEIKELRRSTDALETLVNIENITTLSGSRVIEKDADSVPFDNVDEAADFPESDTPEFEKIDYKAKKKGGILRITRELLEDTAENVMGYLKKWISKKQKATRNALILKVIDTITSGKEKAVTGIDDLKDIFNEILDPAIAVGSSIITNQSGFNWLDKLKDSDGDYILQKDPTEPTKKLLFGSYPVQVLSNKTLKSVTGDSSVKIPLICGNLKEAVTLFDRENLTIDINGSAGEYWNKDMYGIKVRERLDCQPVDKSAIVKAVVEIKTATSESATTGKSVVTEPSTLAQLNAMTVPQLKAYAEKESIDLGGATQKSDIVTAIATAKNINE